MSLYTFHVVSRRSKASTYIDLQNNPVVLIICVFIAVVFAMIWYRYRTSLEKEKLENLQRDRVANILEMDLEKLGQIIDQQTEANTFDLVLETFYLGTKIISNDSISILMKQTTTQANFYSVIETLLANYNPSDSSIYALDAFYLQYYPGLKNLIQSLNADIQYLEASFSTYLAPLMRYSFAEDIVLAGTYYRGRRRDPGFLWAMRRVKNKRKELIEYAMEMQDALDQIVRITN